MPDDKRISLVRLVAFGTVVVTIAGVGLFWWLAWLLARQPLPLRGDSGWWDWMEYVEGTELFDAARTTATVLAIVGVGGAALVAYRRQDTAERAHAVAIEGQRIANAQHTLDSQKYQLDRDRHKLDTDRRNDDRERELRARFTTVAEQLGSENFAVRHAGAYALAALADDWHGFGNDAERQVCVDLLCAQLRTPRVTTSPMSPTPTQNDVANDVEVRKTIVALIRSHRLVDDDDLHSWRDCRIDLSGADLSQFDLSRTDLQRSRLDGANLALAQFVKADLSGASLERTEIHGAFFVEANLSDARLQDSQMTPNTDPGWPNRVTFQRAIMHGTRLDRAQLPHADFEGADLTGAALVSAQLFDADFADAILQKARLNSAKLEEASFLNADVRGTNFTSATFNGTSFRGARHDETTKWPRGSIPQELP
ncbi:pentapeptide repeat-containing protein [Mycolicibacterium iranicum]|uniref:pentapeptide repeat-containing protein n=1 Tax=Mycolicibacterium iranicum TaxID=912594 RepID=UPI0013F4C1D5|nr:pentapeptide repeat-containing protein [Mycolicibacterium iranicum]